MEFRATSAAAERKIATIDGLTNNLTDREAGRREIEKVMCNLGNAVDYWPEWHPILTIPKKDSEGVNELTSHRGVDHTARFVRGFITCPYSEDAAKQLLEVVDKLTGLTAYPLKTPLYSDSAFPVVVEATEITLEEDGTINSRDALTWFAQKLIKDIESFEDHLGARVREGWWGMHHLILGRPHGARSSLFVNQHVGAHMRKILEAFNNSGIFGEINESSLSMLSLEKRNKICETLIYAAVANWNGSDETFTFELRGETCEGHVFKYEDVNLKELRVEVGIGWNDLYVLGHHVTEKDRIYILHGIPKGKRAVAVKFL